jgi:ATP-dependent DNA helicase RecG
LLEILFKSIDNVLNIKPETLKALSRLKINNVRDLLFHRPHAFLTKDTSPNLSNLHDGQLIQTEITVQEVNKSARKFSPIKIVASNETGTIVLVFFNKIPPFIFSKLAVGSKHIITGRVQFFDFYFQITHPEFILKKELASSSYEPQYSLTYGLFNKQLYSYILQTMQLIEQKILNNIADVEIKKYMQNIFEILSYFHLYKFNLPEKKIIQVWEHSLKRISEEELFANQMSLINIRKLKKTKVGKSYPEAAILKQSILAKLNFNLTTGQNDVISEIECDQKSNSQMMIMLQGDVGAGKTLVALLTMLNVVNLGSQAVLMAPTDLLANQHYQFFFKALEDTDIKVDILTGKTSLKDRSSLYLRLENGKTNILIGTHALFQDKVNFKNLGYIVIDEQHKFGVEQRLQLINKSSHPDVLVMTATPIPRSLTLTMFGDMTSSKLKSKPSNRLPIITTAISTSKTDEVIFSLSKRMNEGEKIYWVCPLIDQNDENISDEDKNVYTDVTSRYLKINEIYPGSAEIIHGKMKASQKDILMEKFKTGEIKILVATTVIEVGIDVPEATLIIIENAEKFGLASLHQLRGRVGRGVKQSYCIMIYNPQRLSENGRKRLEIMRTSNDGFYIAEEDMRLRGSGEILGTRQSGEPEFFFADIIRDSTILEKATLKANLENKSKLTDFQIQLFAKNNNELVKSG